MLTPDLVTGVAEAKRARSWGGVAANWAAGDYTSPKYRRRRAVVTLGHDPRGPARAVPGGWRLELESVGDVITPLQRTLRSPR